MEAAGKFGQRNPPGALCFKSILPCASSKAPQPQNPDATGSPPAPPPTMHCPWLQHAAQPEAVDDVEAVGQGGTQGVRLRSAGVPSVRRQPGFRSVATRQTPHGMKKVFGRAQMPDVNGVDEVGQKSTNIRWGCPVQFSNDESKAPCVAC